MTARTASRDTMTFMFDRAAECMPRAHLAALIVTRRLPVTASLIRVASGLTGSA